MYQVIIYETNSYHGDEWYDTKEFKTEAKAKAFVEKFNKNFKEDGDLIARYEHNEDISN